MKLQYYYENIYHIVHNYTVYIQIIGFNIFYYLLYGKIIFEFEILTGPPAVVHIILNVE